MSLTKDFELHQRVHLDALANLRNGVPEGLPAQLSALAPVVESFEAAKVKISTDPHLSAEGKAAQIQAAREAALGHIEQWQTSRTTGLDEQIAGLDGALASPDDTAGPAPSDAIVSAMAARLAQFDSTEMEVLYADATDRERILIEMAAERAGRVPRRRGPAGELVWEPVLADEHIQAARAARQAKANPAAAVARQDAQRIRNTYVAIAQAARSLLK